MGQDKNGVVTPGSDRDPGSVTSGGSCGGWEVGRYRELDRLTAGAALVNEQTEQVQFLEDLAGELEGVSRLLEQVGEVLGMPVELDPTLPEDVVGMRTRYQWILARMVGAIGQEPEPDGAVVHCASYDGKECRLSRSETKFADVRDPRFLPGAAFCEETVEQWRRWWHWYIDSLADAAKDVANRAGGFLSQTAGRIKL